MLPDLVTPEKNRIITESIPPFIKCDLEWYDGKDGINCKAKQVYAFVDGKCVEKTYGGCGGNTNNFETQDECVAHCDGPLDEVLHAVVSGESSHYSLLHEVARDHSNGLPYFILLDHSTNCQIAKWHLSKAWTCNLLQ